jgi:transposase
LPFQGESGCTTAFNSTEWRWYNKEVAKHWNKFRQIQKQLSHLVSNCIVEIASIYSCDTIYVEWLKSLSCDSFSHEMNWGINSTVRQAIYDKVQYKASLAGIEFAKPIPAGYTSQFCPKCGKRGQHLKAPDKLKEIIKSGSWFYCPHCKYNADRDYVATQNLARRALFGNCFQSKTFAYTTKVISDKLFRQSIEENSKLRHCLNGWKNKVFLRPMIYGWKNSVFLKPVIERGGTLRL